MASKPQKTVLIGITGCIAAYKAAEIVRGLQKADVRVKVMMTEHATHFIDPLTFRALTNEPVAVELFDNPQDPIHDLSLLEEARSRSRCSLHGERDGQDRRMGLPMTC